MKTRKWINSYRVWSNVVALTGLSLVAYCLAAWITHIVVCLKTASWGFLIAGAIMAPVGIVHGTGVWLGFW